MNKPKKSPIKKTPEVIEEVLTRIANGESVNAICRDKHMPNPDSFYTWMNNDTNLSDKYARAKEACAHHYAEEIIEIADRAKNRVEVEKARIQVDARKWAASKLHPKKYGDKINLEHSGGVEVKKVTIEIVDGAKHKSE